MSVIVGPSQRVCSSPTFVRTATFEGRTFHSARWDHDYDLEGKRVAVVGTGASAIQFIPHLQPKVRSMAVFQRTPPWVMPHPDRPLSAFEHRLYAQFPPRREQVIFSAVIFAHGARRPDDDLLQIAQPSNQSIGHPQTEIILSLIGIQRLERKHRNGFDHSRS